MIRLRQRKPLPDRSFIITFDDGYQTVYDQAFLVLQRYNMLATVFLTVREKGPAKPTDPLPSHNGRPMLSWSEMQEMHRFGITFGAHTQTHPNLGRLPVDQVETQIFESKAVIEEALGIPVTCFTYPLGRYNHWIRELVKQKFTCACSDRLGFVHAKSNLYALERVDAYYLRTKKLFDLLLTGLFPWYIRTRSIPRWVRRTIQNSLG